MRAVAGKKSEQRAFQDQTARVAALLGGTLGQKLRNKPMPLDAEFKAQAKLRRERWAAASKLSKAILAPLHKIIHADKEARQAVMALRQLTRPRRPKILRPRSKRPRIKSHVQPGSILVFRGLPYDVTWAAGSGWGQIQTTGGGGFADQSAGTFSAEADSLSDGGSAWGGAGLAVWFQPYFPATYVRFAADAFGQYDWDDNSNGYGANSAANIGVYIESWDLNGQDYRIEQDRRITLWSDGTGWWEEHGFRDVSTFWFPNDTYFVASEARLYKVWTWVGTWCDAYGEQPFGCSTASGQVGIQSYFCIFEQWPIWDPSRVSRV